MRQEKSDISAIYFFAIINGLIQLSIPVGIQAIIGFVLGGTLSASLVLLISIIVTGVLLAGITQINQMRITEKIQQRIFVRYSFAFADHIPRLDLKQADGYYLPELVNRFFDIVPLQKSISKLFLDLPISMMQIFFGLVLLAFYHPFFILFGLLLIALLWLMLYATGSRGLETSLAKSTYKFEVAGWFEEMARLVQSFKFSLGAKLHLKKADAKTIRYLKARTAHFRVLMLQYKVLVAFKVLITAAMLITGVVLLLNQQINVGQFVATEIIILMLINSVEKIIINLDSVYDVLTAVDKIEKVTDKPVEAFGTYMPGPAETLGVEASNLTFSYNGARPVIKNVSFSIPAGTKVAITGPDGAGKSTLLKLLAGMYSEFSGALMFNQIPIINYDLQALRERAGIMLQEDDIFNGSLWENITMGRETSDSEYVRYLCRESGLHRYLATLPLGYDTVLDPTGQRLPRNVIKKILFVRALAAKPMILIMEDPWQGIEEQSRDSIQHLLLHLQHTTVIVATNDETFLHRCDQIIHLTN